MVVDEDCLDEEDTPLKLGKLDMLEKLAAEDEFEMAARRKSVYTIEQFIINRSLRV